MASATLLLPDRSRFGGAAPVGGDRPSALARADLVRMTARRMTATSSRGPSTCCRAVGRWPPSTRQRDAGDAANVGLAACRSGVRAPDINGARLLAYGARSGTARRPTREALLRPLRPLFGDAGFPIDAPTPSRWYLRLPREAQASVVHRARARRWAPTCSSTCRKVDEGRRWRALLSEAQVVLHNHPLNAAAHRRRQAAGELAVVLGRGHAARPRHASLRPRCSATTTTLRALAALAQVAGRRRCRRAGAPRRPTRCSTCAMSRDLAVLRARLVRTGMLAALRSGRVRHDVRLDFADGAVYTLRAASAGASGAGRCVRSAHDVESRPHEARRDCAGASPATGRWPSLPPLLRASLRGARRDLRRAGAAEARASAAARRAGRPGRRHRLAGASAMAQRSPHRRGRRLRLRRRHRLRGRRARPAHARRAPCVARGAESHRPRLRPVAGAGRRTGRAAAGSAGHRRPRHRLPCGHRGGKARGWQVLVTDHHLPGEQLPPADAIVDPNLRGDAFPSKALAGVGVMFYVLLALRRRLREQGAFAGTSPTCRTLLDLVAVGTVADLVPLDANNRALVAAGLRRLRAGQGCAGLRALIEVAQRDARRLTAGDIGYAHRAAHQCRRPARRHGARHRVPAQRRPRAGPRDRRHAQRDQRRAPRRAAADDRRGRSWRWRASR